MNLFQRHQDTFGTNMNTLNWPLYLHIIDKDHRKIRHNYFFCKLRILQISDFLFFSLFCLSASAADADFLNFSIFSFFANFLTLAWWLTRLLSLAINLSTYRKKIRIGNKLILKSQDFYGKWQKNNLNFLICFRNLKTKTGIECCKFSYLCVQCQLWIS